jgi:hypothetical protein
MAGQLLAGLWGDRSRSGVGQPISSDVKAHAAQPEPHAQRVVLRRRKHQGIDVLIFNPQLGQTDVTG